MKEVHNSSPCIFRNFFKTCQTMNSRNTRICHFCEKRSFLILQIYTYVFILQYVNCGHYSSDHCATCSGIPQGSNHFLHNLVINDISSSLNHSQILLYADAKAIIHVIHTETMLTCKRNTLQKVVKLNCIQHTYHTHVSQSLKLISHSIPYSLISIVQHFP